MEVSGEMVNESCGTIGRPLPGISPGTIGVAGELATDCNTVKPVFSVRFQF